MSVSEKLKQLAQLREQGALTESQFQAQAAKVAGDRPGRSESDEAMDCYLAAALQVDPMAPQTWGYDTRVVEHPTTGAAVLRVDFPGRVPDINLEDDQVFEDKAGEFLLLHLPETYGDVG